MKQITGHCILLTAVAATLFFTSLGKSRLWDRDEPRNAGCAAEMMQRGDLVVPIFNDELRPQKPVLLYWLMISAYSLFGVSEFAARFWSALLGLGTVLLTYGIARRLFDPTVALLSGIVMASTLMFCVAARAATPDSALIFFSTLGIFFYVMGTFGRRNGEQDPLALQNPGHWFPVQTGYVILMNFAFALGVLTKGPVGIVLPTAILGMFILIQRLPPASEDHGSQHGPLYRFINACLRNLHPIHFVQTCWSMRPLTAVAVVLIVAAPWYVWVGWKTDGDFTRMFFLNENLSRATSVMEDHGGSWWYYPAAIAVGFFPWSIFLCPVVLAVDSQLGHQSKHRVAVTLMACWVLVQIGLFTLAETKLPSYVTPCYPALAMLTSFCLLRWIPGLRGSGFMWLTAGYGTLVASGLVIAIGLGVATGKYFPGIWWIALIGLVPIAGGVIGVLFLQVQQPQRALAAMIVSAISFCLLFFGVGTVAVDSARQTDLVLDEIRAAGPAGEVATYRCLESSWVYYVGRPIYELLPGFHSQSSAKSLNRVADWTKKPLLRSEDFVELHPGAMILTTDEHVDELLGQLPTGFEIVRESEFFLQHGRKLLLIKRLESETATAESATSDSMR